MYDALVVLRKSPDYEFVGVDREGGQVKQEVAMQGEHQVWVWI